MVYRPEGQDDERRLRAFLESGTEITGGLVGAAIGLLIGGPPGAVLGAAAPPLVTRTLRRGAMEAMHRQLSERERIRVAAVTAIAADRIQRKLDLGYEARHDGFFQGEPGNRSVADEIAEGVLMAAQREHEERKLKYSANLLANIAFSPNIDRDNANHFIRQAEALSYRQLLLLSVLSHKEERRIRPGLLAVNGTIPFERMTVLEDLYDLYRRGLLFVEGGGYMLDAATLSPGSLSVRGPGHVLYTLMELQNMDEGDLLVMANLIRV